MMRYGMPERRRASSTVRDCALVRYSTAARFSASSRRACAAGAGDELGFVEIVAGAVVEDARAARLLGVEPLLLAILVLGDDRRGGVENHLRRAVVALEPHDRRFGKVVLEVEDVLEVGAAPLVDRLVRVADDAQIAMRRRRAAG